MKAEIREAIAKQGDVIPLIKATLIGGGSGGLQGSNVASPEEGKIAQTFNSAGALAPPYDPESLCQLLENSNSLRQNIDAYVTNIDGFGYQLDPVVNLEADDAVEEMRNAMFAERLHAAEVAGEAPESVAMPKDDEVEKEMEEVSVAMRREKTRLDAFFNYCCGDSSFINLRRRTRQDLETMGNGYWEVLRNGGGQVAQFVFVPGFTVRLLPYTEADKADADVRVQVAPFTYAVEQRRVMFRRFVQVHENRTVYFKEFGDKRIMSARTGKIYPTPEELASEASEGSGTPQATEIMHFKIPSPRSSYGVPRWIGTLLAVLGSRQSEEVNYLYFDNKTVPPLAITVSGGRMTEEAVQRIGDYLENEIKGKRNFHKVLILEADSEASSNGGQVKIDIKPLTDAQMSDALFQNYDAQNIDKVGQSFRLPRMLRGDIRDFNRSTAEAALGFAEMQVFQPEREDFDWIMNRKILDSLETRFWRFQSNGPITRDPGKLADIVGQLLRAGAITPRDARTESARILNHELPKLKDAFWMDQPIAVTAAGYIPADAAGAFIDADSATAFGNGDIETLEEGADEASALVEELKSLTTAELESGGALTPGQRERFRRLPPTHKRSVVEQAAELVKLRDAIKEAEAERAAAEYSAAQDAYAKRAASRTAQDADTDEE